MSEAKYFLADVGGTNTRFAIGNKHGVDPNTFTHVRNDKFENFQAAATQFLQGKQIHNFDGGCIAVAGPVDGRNAKLTNRCWHFDAGELETNLRCKKIGLVNDMSALAHSISALSQTQITRWNCAHSARPNNQSLVIGLGTGVNGAALFGSNVMTAELGHSTITSSIERLLPTNFRAKFEHAITIEDCLSGGGLANLYFSISNQKISAAEICKAAAKGTDEHAVNACQLFGAILSIFLREVALHYLPQNGIYLAGSVARGVCNSPAGPVVKSWLSANQPMNETLRTIQLSLITDDAAALFGCLEIAKNTA